MALGSDRTVMLGTDILAPRTEFSDISVSGDGWGCENKRRLGLWRTPSDLEAEHLELTLLFPF